MDRLTLTRRSIAALPSERDARPDIKLASLIDGQYWKPKQSALIVGARSTPPAVTASLVGFTTTWVTAMSGYPRDQIQLAERVNGADFFALDWEEFAEYEPKKFDNIFVSYAHEHLGHEQKIAKLIQEAWSGKGVCWLVGEANRNYAPIIQLFQREKLQLESHKRGDIWFGKAYKDLTPKDSRKYRLTIGMATYKDFDGVYFTLQGLRMYQDLNQVELLVVDTAPESCALTMTCCQNVGARYIHAPKDRGTAKARNRVFQEARGTAVLCLDCHVLLKSGSIAALKKYYNDHPFTPDLLQGPVESDDGNVLSTHFEEAWDRGMWGIWGQDPRGKKDKPFEIRMQGLGLFSMRRDAWPGFNENFVKFGGEEGYIHEKVRQRGGRCLCLPWLVWTHRFGRDETPDYAREYGSRLYNYLVGWRELGLPEQDVLDHFRPLCSEEEFKQAQEDADKVLIRETVPVSPKGSPLVSVLMPTYGRVGTNQHLIEEAVESFNRQDYDKKELLILNDHPKQTIVYNHPQVRVFNMQQRMSGIGEKLAWLCGAAKGDYLCRMDDDDLMLPWRITQGLEQLSDKMYWRPLKVLVDRGMQLSVGRTVGHHAGMWRREVLSKIGGYPRETPNVAEDGAFNRKCFEVGEEKIVELTPGRIAYIYRWGHHNDHLSGDGVDIARTYNILAGKQYPSGTFTLRPHWRHNHAERVTNFLKHKKPKFNWKGAQGWFDYAPLYAKLAKAVPSNGTIVEIGSYQGRSIIYMAEKLAELGKHNVQLFTVDNGFSKQLDKLREHLLWAGLNHKVNVLASGSAMASRLFRDQSVDALFINGAHDRQSVITDLQLWWPKVKDGGICAGRDFAPDTASEYFDLREVVCEFFGKPEKELQSSVTVRCFEVVK